jgi:2-oxoisovalerate dehydrogenase E2 component (dihydrolipoyl transacylase)
MATYRFKLPDIGEGIAEAEVVAWHVKVGDRVEEDQQLADMMTDKATVEMESPVAGTVVKLAGEVGDLIAIGSVLVEIETEADVNAIESRTNSRLATVRWFHLPRWKKRFRPSRFPETAVHAPTKVRPEPVEGRSETLEQRPSTSSGRTDVGNAAKVLASPAVRQRARDLGIDLAEVKTTADRVRHSDLDAYLLYNGGSVSHAPRPARGRNHQGRRTAPQDRREYAGGQAPHPALHFGRRV